MFLLSVITFILLYIITQQHEFKAKVTVSSQTESTTFIKDVDKNLCIIFDTLNKINLEFHQFHIEQSVTHSLMDTLASTLSSAIENINHPYQQKVHTAQ